MIKLEDELKAYIAQNNGSDPEWSLLIKCQDALCTQGKEIEALIEKCANAVKFCGECDCPKMSVEAIHALKRIDDGLELSQKKPVVMSAEEYKKAFNL